MRRSGLSRPLQLHTAPAQLAGYGQGTRASLGGGTAALQGLALDQLPRLPKPKGPPCWADMAWPH